MTDKDKEWVSKYNIPYDALVPFGGKIDKAFREKYPPEERYKLEAFIAGWEAGLRYAAEASKTRTIHLRDGEWEIGETIDVTD